MRLGFREKFIGFLVLLAVVPLGVTGWRLININREGVQSSVLELQRELAERHSRDVATKLLLIQKDVSFIINILNRKLTLPEKTQLLQAFMDTHPDFQQISLLGDDGAEKFKVYGPAATDLPDTMTDHTKEDLYQRYKNRAAFGGALRVQALTLLRDTPVLRIYYPLRPSLDLYVVVSVADLQEDIETRTIGGSGFVMLVGEDGVPILYPRARRIDVDKVPGWQIVQDALQAGGAGASREYVDFENVRQVGSFSPVEMIHGAVIIQQPWAEAYIASEKLKREAFYFILALAVLAMLGAAVLARTLAKPVLSLTAGADAIARGDFNHRVDVHTGDELEDLANTFNRMVSKLKEYSDLQVDRVIAEQRKNEAILFSIDDGIIMTDNEGNIQLANRRARSIAGVPEDEAIEGKTLAEVVREEKVRAALLEVAAEAKDGEFREIDLSTEEVSRVYKAIARQVVRPGKDKAIGVVLAIHDITLERELLAMKEDFLNTVTHDLRNPMGAIRGFLEFLLKEVPGPINKNQQKMLEAMDRASQRLLTMINNILDMAKLKHGKLEITRGPCRISEVAARAVELLEPLAQRKEIGLTFEGPSDLVISADSTLLERVFVNLIGNAIKFTPEEGKIKATVVDAGDKVRIGIEDDGEGIAPDFLPHVFGKFEQAHAGKKKGGTGLGLAICKHAAEAHGGRIWVESEVGKGAQFFIEIPKEVSS